MAVKSKTELFNNLAAGTKWDAGVAFHRTNGLPIDQFSIFQGLECADLTAADDGSLEWYIANNPVAYAGQVVTVVEDNISRAYVINANGTYSPIGDTWYELTSST